MTTTYDQTDDARFDAAGAAFSALLNQRRPGLAGAIAGLPEYDSPFVDAWDDRAEGETAQQIGARAMKYFDAEQRGETGAAWAQGLGQPDETARPGSR